MHTVPVNSLNNNQNLLPRAVSVWLTGDDGVTKFLFKISHIFTHQKTDCTIDVYGMSLLYRLEQTL